MPFHVIKRDSCPLSKKILYYVIAIVIALLIGAYFCSSRVNYVYDQYSVESIRKNEIQLAKEKIKSTFGTPNTFAMIIPAGDNQSEKEIVAEIKELRHTQNVIGLSDIRSPSLPTAATRSNITNTARP